MSTVPSPTTGNMADPQITAIRRRAHQEMVQGLKSRLKDKKYSDLMIVCGGLVLWRVHKVIVCSGCTWFDKYATGSAIHIHQSGVDLTRVLIYFLYTHDYHHSDGSDQLMMHAVLYGFIRNLGVRHLPELITAKFSLALESHYKSTDFLTVTKRIFSEPPAKEHNGLRNAVLKFLTRDDTQKLKELRGSPAFMQMSSEVANFQAEIMDLANKMRAATSQPSSPTSKQVEHPDAEYEIVHAEEAADLPTTA